MTLYWHISYTGVHYYLSIGCFKVFASCLSFPTKSMILYRSCFVSFIIVLSYKFHNSIKNKTVGNCLDCQFIFVSSICFTLICSFVMLFSYQSLTLLEYLLKTGDDRVLLKMKDNIYIVKALTEYRFVEKDGKDQVIHAS